LLSIGRRKKEDPMKVRFAVIVLVAAAGVVGCGGNSAAPSHKDVATAAQTVAQQTPAQQIGAAAAAVQSSETTATSGYKAQFKAILAGLSPRLTEMSTDLNSGSGAEVLPAMQQAVAVIAEGISAIDAIHVPPSATGEVRQWVTALTQEQTALHALSMDASATDTSAAQQDEQMFNNAHVDDQRAQQALGIN
jgi:hypothetical protein